MKWVIARNDGPKLTGNPCNEIELNHKTVLIDAKILKQRIRNKSLEKLGI